MTELEQVQEIIHTALANVINSDEVLLSRWVLVLEAVSSAEPGTVVSYVTSPSLASWEALGLTSAAASIAKDQIVNPEYLDEDEEDEE